MNDLRVENPNPCGAIFAFRFSNFAAARLAYTAELHLAIAMTALLLAAACGPKPVSAPAVFFPESNEVPGWSKGETRTFEADKLWEYIDGDADRYVQAGVVRTLATDYRYQNKVDAAADVYVMKTPEGARKIFDAESSLGSQPIRIGDAARLFENSMVFRKGAYLVRLTAYQEAPEVGKALVELGRGVEKRLEERK
jgi:hypothetical protein